VSTVVATRPAPLIVPHRTLVQLLRRNAVVFQVVFACLWSLRFVAALGVPEVAVATAVVGGFAVRASFRVTAGPRARDAFRTVEGRRFLRPVTWLTVIQLAASVVLPIITGVVGAAEWSLPLVALTIGLFLIGFSGSLEVPVVAVIGAVATVVSLGLPFVAAGGALVAATSASMILALLVSCWCCVRAVQRDGS
jgi:hypothetical protein